MLPREITANRSAQEIRFELPRRPIGRLRLFGLVPMAFACLFAWMPGTHMLQFLRQAIYGSGSAMEWIFAAFLSLFVLAAMVPFGFGLFILAGRTRVTLRQDRIVITELAGPVRWSRKVKFDQILWLEIGGATTKDGNMPSAFSSLCGITAILKDSKKTPLAVGYPRNWLEPLVGEVRDWMKSRGADVAVNESKPLAADPVQPAQTEVRFERPTGSAIELSNSGGCVEFRIPSRGLFRESNGLVVFGALWCLVVGVIGTLNVTQGGGISGLGVLALFFCIGLAMFLPGLHLGTRRWTICVDRSELRVTMKSLLRSREWKWAANEIEDIRAGNSSVSVNNQPLEQLQILARPGGTKTGLLTGRTHDELAWIATALRGAIGAEAAGTADAPPRIDPASRRG